MNDIALSAGSLEHLINGYIKLRDKKKAIEEQHKAELQRYSTAMDEIESFLKAHIKAQNLQSISCDAGTAFINRKRSATVADTAMFREHVISTGSFDLADFRAKVEAVEVYIQEHDGRLPPGVNFTTREVVQVQRK